MADEPPTLFDRSVSQKFSHDTDVPSGVVLTLNQEGMAAQEDVAWIDEQYNLGALMAFRGEYIAVVGKTILGHHKSLKKLREDVSRETGHSPSRIVTTYVDLPTR